MKFLPAEANAFAIDTHVMHIICFESFWGKLRDRIPRTSVLMTIDLFHGRQALKHAVSSVT